MSTDACQWEEAASTMEPADMEIAAIIPAFNEVRVIGRVVTQAQAHLPVLVVDDGSSDGTGAVAEQAGATVLRHARNRGKGAALRTGFRWAIQADLDAVVTLDADAQHNPDEIPTFLATYRSSAADLIIGQRDFAEMPFPRRYSNPLGSWLLSLVLGEPIMDNQSGYRLYGHRLMAILDQETTGFEFEVEAIGAALMNDLKVEWIPIETIYHTETRSYFHPIADSARFLRTVWRARAWRRPPRPHPAGGGGQQKSA
jgi:glycosyltransferase involved in cell wall biosynthesis